MPKLIFDEFTHQDISPQLRYQRRKRAASKCRICGQPSVNVNFCEKHRQQFNAAQNGRLPFVPRAISAANEPVPDLDEII